MSPNALKAGPRLTFSAVKVQPAGEGSRIMGPPFALRDNISPGAGVSR